MWLLSLELFVTVSWSNSRLRRMKTSQICSVLHLKPYCHPVASSPWVSWSESAISCTFGQFVAENLAMLSDCVCETQKHALYTTQQQATSDILAWLGLKAMAQAFETCRPGQSYQIWLALAQAMAHRVIFVYRGKWGCEYFVICGSIICILWFDDVTNCKNHSNSSTTTSMMLKDCECKKMNIK